MAAGEVLPVIDSVIEPGRFPPGPAAHGRPRRDRQDHRQDSVALASPPTLGPASWAEGVAEAAHLTPSTMLHGWRGGHGEGVAGSEERLHHLSLEIMPSGAVVDLDDPEIGIALHRARDIGIGLRLFDQPALEGREPAERAIAAPALGSAGGSRDRAGSVSGSGCRPWLRPGARRRRRCPRH